VAATAPSSPSASPAPHPLLDAVAPLAEEFGATLVGPADVVSSDIPLYWKGKLVGGFRRVGLHGALERIIAGVERELGAPLAEMSREDKQEAVRRLDERGVFMLRRSVEDVADALGVSRFTVYNYLGAVHG
jgi:hypothetical protein